MKKNKRIFIVLVGLALIFIPVVVFLVIKPDPVKKERFDARTITFAVPDVCEISENHLKLFNDALRKDGYHYKLKIKYLKYEEYTEKLERALKKKSVDVAFLGLDDESGTNKIYNLINSGLVYNLDEILSSDKGAVLYHAFPERLWESVKCNRHIYSIPSVFADAQGPYAAFNRDYIKDETIEGWDGKLDGIYEILKDVKWDDGNAPRFQYLINQYSFEDMIGCEIKYGLLFDYDTLTIENPLKSKKFTGFLHILDQMKKDGYMDQSVSYMDNPGLGSNDVVENIKSGNFLVALSSGYTNEIFERDNIKIKRVTPYLSSRVSGSIGIAKNVEDIDAVVDFLGLFYSNEKYGNILMYGLENKDYKVVDGVACTMDGKELDGGFITRLALNLFLNVYPVQEDTYRNNRKEEYFSFYDSVELSPFVGFEPDTGKTNPVSTDMDEFMTELRDSTVKEAASRVGDQLASDGMDKYLDSVRRQWKEYQK